MKKQVVFLTFHIGVFFLIPGLVSCSQSSSLSDLDQKSDASQTKKSSSSSSKSNKSYNNAKGFTKLSKNGLPLPPSENALSKSSKLIEHDKYGYKTYPDSIRTRVVRTTSYSHQEREKGAPGRKNCIGGILKYGKVRSAAADWSVYPVGTKFRVKGLPQIFVVDDYGSALVGTNTIDIFHPTLSLMNKWNTRKTEITIIQMGDYERSLKILGKRKGYRHCNKMYVNLKRRISDGEVVLLLDDEEQQTADAR